MGRVSSSSASGRKVVDDAPQPEAEEYEFDDVRDCAISGGKILYLVKWKGYADSENTWEPAESLENAGDAVKARMAELKAARTRRDGATDGDEPGSGGAAPARKAGRKRASTEQEEAAGNGASPRPTKAAKRRPSEAAAAADSLPASGGAVSEREREKKRMGRPPKKSLPAGYSPKATGCSEAAPAAVGRATATPPPAGSAATPMSSSKSATVTAAEMLASEGPHASYEVTGITRRPDGPVVVARVSGGRRIVLELTEARKLLPQPLLSFLLARLQFPETSSQRAEKDESTTTAAAGKE